MSHNSCRQLVPMEKRPSSMPLAIRFPKDEVDTALLCDQLLRSEYFLQNVSDCIDIIAVKRMMHQALF